jgi:2-dehydro-3-deoxyphosphogluconate aldolase/(4S)-4-hydroxy-2-oxoglutarate aldolase
LEESNLKAWFAAGVVAVGMGSKLITSDILQDKKYDLLKANTAEALRIIKNIRGK